MPTCPTPEGRRDFAIGQPFEQPDRAVSRVACQPLGPQIEATFDTVYHGLGDSNLNCMVRSRAYCINYYPGLVVDQVVALALADLLPP